MLVADLRHFLELPDATPGPARRLADQLTSIVRAATSRPPGERWTSALSCARRPNRRPFLGHVEILRSDPPDSIYWRCAECGDEGIVSGWEGSPFDLRASVEARPSELSLIVPADVAVTLRTVMLLDVECERLVFGSRIVDGSILMEGSSDELDILIDAVAAEANHEHARSRQRRLDTAYDVLTEFE